MISPTAEMILTVTRAWAPAPHRTSVSAQPEVKRVEGFAQSQGFAPRARALEQSRAMFTTPGSPLTASMLRDIEGNGPTEAEHLLGDLMRRGGAQENPSSILRTAYLHVATYEARRARLANAKQDAGKS